VDANEVAGETGAGYIWHKTGTERGGGALVNTAMNLRMM
jgi:hypothetical protein